ncbi:MAG: helix-turn-helix transcriptional regulator [Peptococcaceae bacterium]|nr:helix-turn-helix transcriptional regulator [Peptococcaceae bacterium]
MMAILEEKNLSERQVSMDLGYSDSYMNKVKNGSIALTIDFLEEFCNELNVRPEEFLHCRKRAHQISTCFYRKLRNCRKKIFSVCIIWLNF